MWKLLIYSIFQSALLAGGQIFLKFALQKMHSPGWTREFLFSLLLNWQFAAAGIFFGGGSLLWMYILKHFPLSMAYPMISLSYVFGMLGAVFFFHEHISYTRWFGVFLIITGCCFVAK